MESEVLKTAGQIAGIGGLALGVFLLLYRDIIRKNIFPKLPPDKAYRLLRLITVAVWSVAIAGIAAWVFAPRAPGPVADQTSTIRGDNNVSTQMITTNTVPTNEIKSAVQSSTVDGKANTVIQEKIE